MAAAAAAAACGRKTRVFPPRRGDKEAENCSAAAADGTDGKTNQFRVSF